MSDFVGLALGVLFLPLVISLFMIYLLASAVLYVGIWTFWIPRGRRVLFVYSNSPVWKEYIEQEILPRLPAESLVMNYSERARWRRVSFGTLVYWHFAGGKEYNPIGVVLRPLRRGRVFRFWSAFREFKHGKPQALGRVKSEFFKAMAS